MTWQIPKINVVDLLSVCSWGFVLWATYPLVAGTHEFSAFAILGGAAITSSLAMGIWWVTGTGRIRLLTTSCIWGIFVFIFAIFRSGHFRQIEHDVNRGFALLAGGVPPVRQNPETVDKPIVNNDENAIGGAHEVQGDRDDPEEEVKEESGKVAIESTMETGQDPTAVYSEENTDAGELKNEVHEKAKPSLGTPRSLSKEVEGLCSALSLDPNTKITVSQSLERFDLQFELRGNDLPKIKELISGKDWVGLLTLMASKRNENFHTIANTSSRHIEDWYLRHPIVKLLIIPDKDSGNQFPRQLKLFDERSLRNFLNDVVTVVQREKGEPRLSFLFGEVPGVQYISLEDHPDRLGYLCNWDLLSEGVLFLASDSKCEDARNKILGPFLNSVSINLKKRELGEVTTDEIVDVLEDMTENIVDRMTEWAESR